MQKTPVTAGVFCVLYSCIICVRAFAPAVMWGGEEDFASLNWGGQKERETAPLMKVYISHKQIVEVFCCISIKTIGREGRPLPYNVCMRRK